MITNLPEFYPQFGVTEKLEEKMEEIHDNFKHEKLYANQKLDQDWTKSLLILYHWIDGMTYSNMSQEFNAEPGDIFSNTTKYGTLGHTLSGRLLDFGKIKFLLMN